MDSTSNSLTSSISHLSSHHDTIETESSDGSSSHNHNKRGRRMGASRLFRLVKFLSKPAREEDEWEDCDDDEEEDDACKEPPKTIFIPRKTPKLIRASSISIGTILADESLMSIEGGSQRRRSSIDCTSMLVASSLASSPQQQQQQLISASDGRMSRNLSTRSPMQQVLHRRPMLLALLLLVALAAGTLLDGDSSQSTTAPTNGATTTTVATTATEIQPTKAPKERGKYLPASSSKAQGGIATDMYNTYKELQQEYHSKAFQPQNMDKWKVLNEKDGAKVSLFEHESDPTCPYVRMETVIPTSVSSCFEFLGIHNWEWSMPKMDPTYESHSVHANYTHQGVNMILVRKKTHRIVTFGKRDFVFLSVTDLPLADGTYVSGSVSVETPDVPRSASYTRAFQDSIAFYKPVKDALTGKEQCHLTIVCRIDLNDSVEEGGGGWIPMWLYVKTVGATGIKAVLKMKHALMEMENKKDTSMATDRTNSAPTVANVMSFTAPPTPSPEVQRGRIFPKTMAFLSSNKNVEHIAAAETTESSGWWNRPRGGAFATASISERWKPLYEVFTHVPQKERPHSMAKKATTWGQHALRRIPILGDRILGGFSSS